ncbi:glycosyltransferase family 2 protein [Actimicrobium sp. CCC2.4]|uniref:glycosyltransferase family 2 protein n=1 Tax=Actimicrobium sp. CCC2.4 TaxID=3048606 RepID=UPI002AC94708|nr:glycosyltransferase family 2 protein [Actimicrobium sp. CCC2.4]MEB0136036.1 glycosyltransferase family 2 protein [Actimicrobium sp. CCC2.4]WPX32699.1 glycosyltransferase family 2 protein [Actimicrobium sp. CCC2.4]
MSFLVATLLFIALVIISIPVLLLLLQAMVAFFPLRKGDPATGRRPTLTVLVPAHNESSGVIATISSLLPQLRDGDRLIVVADNCSDDTAAIALKAGAKVLIRTDLLRRGKGYALDFGVRALAEAPPEVVIIIDADCIAGTGLIDRIARLSFHTGRPIQALSLMRALENSGPMKKIAEFAWLVKNLVRPLGYHRLGLPCQLMGTGMAFSWDTISTASLANGNLVEDLKLGMDLAKAGNPPLFCPEVLVSSTFPMSESGTQTQRTRWEHGHISMILTEARPLLFGGLRQRNAGMIALGLDLCVPPLALLTLMVLVLFAVSGLFAVVTGNLVPVLFACLVMGLMVTAVMLSWWRYGRERLSAANLAMAVFYVFWKIPLYLKFFVSRQVDWVRSKRDGEL